MESNNLNFRLLIPNIGEAFLILMSVWSSNLNLESTVTSLHLSTFSIALPDTVDTLRMSVLLPNETVLGLYFYSSIVTTRCLISEHYELRSGSLRTNVVPVAEIAIRI